MTSGIEENKALVRSFFDPIEFSSRAEPLTCKTVSR